MASGAQNESPFGLPADYFPWIHALSSSPSAHQRFTSGTLHFSLDWDTVAAIPHHHGMDWGSVLQTQNLRKPETFARGRTLLWIEVLFHEVPASEPGVPYVAGREIDDWGMACHVRHDRANLASWSNLRYDSSPGSKPCSKL